MTARIILSILLLFISSLAAYSGPWVKEFTKNGITVYTKKMKGSSLISFRAEAVIHAPMEIINSILLDTKSQTKWMPDCIVSEILLKNSEFHEIAYSETRVPVVSNRDVVVETKITKSGHTIIHDFKAIDRRDLKPEITGKVRIKDMEGKWELTRREGGTDIVYEVRADPGGNIPTWLANSASKDVPYKTIMGLIQMTASQLAP